MLKPVNYCDFYNNLKLNIKHVTVIYLTAAHVFYTHTYKQTMVL